MRILLRCSCILLLTACGGEEQQPKANKSFFDLVAFADSCSKQWDAGGVTFTKTMWVNGVEETKKNARVQWPKDLALLKAFDINKPSWAKSFHVTEQQTGAGKELVYTALDSNTAVKYMRVVFDSLARPAEIHGLRYTHNILYTLWQQVDLICDSVYDVHTRQEIWLLKDKEYRLRTSFSEKLSAGQ